MKNTKSSFYSNQKGMVSVIVTMILIIVMTLVVLGMSQNSNREQKQALDRQLSDQAFYNAESGINDWAEYLYKHQNDAAPGLPAVKDTCDNTGFTGADVPVPQIDGATGVNSYSCILYDKAPLSLEYDTVTTSDSIVTPIEPYNMPGASKLQSIELTWRAKDGSTNTSGCNLAVSPGSAIPQALPAACSIGGLRIDIVNPSNLNRNSIIQNNYPAFILPSNGGGTLTYRSGPFADQGDIGRANCSAGGQCRLVIDNLNLQNGQRRYMHIKSLYSNVSLTIRGCRVPAANCGNGNQDVRFNSSQIEIDSTGKSNDILRRVKVRLPVQDQFENTGDFSLKTTQSICKLIVVEEPTATLDDKCK